MQYLRGPSPITSAQDTRLGGNKEVAEEGALEKRAQLAEVVLDLGGKRSPGRGVRGRRK